MDARILARRRFSRGAGGGGGGNPLVFGNEIVTGTPLATNAPASRKLAFIGDSRVGGDSMGQFAGNVVHTLGEWCWVQLTAAGLFENNYGAGGSTIFNAANTQAPAAVAAGAKVFVILTGTNGARGTGEGDEVDDLASRQAETLALLSALDVADGTIFLCNEVPGSTGSTSGSLKFAHHEWINGLTTANTSLANAELVIVNTWDATVDTATSGAATELDADWIGDGLHPTDRGQEFMAKAVWTAANAYFTQPHLDFSSPDQLLLDGTVVDAIARGNVPDGFLDFTGADALVYSTSGAGANTVLTVTNTGVSNLSMSLRRVPASTTDAVVLIEYDMDAQPGAATTAGVAVRRFEERFSIRNFDHGSGVNRANVNTPTADGTLTSQLQYLGGRRRVCYNLGASAASLRLDMTFRVPPGRTVRFHRLDIYER